MEYRAAHNAPPDQLVQPGFKGICLRSPSGKRPLARGTKLPMLTQMQL